MPRDRGSVLLVVLFIMFVLGMAGLSFAYRTGLDSRATKQRLILERLRCQASSATAIAMARLKADGNDFDHPAEAWCAHRPLTEENWLEEWRPNSDGAAEYVTDYTVQDESGKLNTKFASEADLKKLGMADERVAALFDWMDGDEVARADGAESSYYRQLQPLPYLCKNAPLESMDELLKIKGFSRRQCYGSPVGVADGTPSQGWCGLLTCLTDGRINLNSAPLDVLKTLPIREKAAEQAVAYREFGLDSDGELKDHAFRSADDIEQLQGLTDAERQTLLAAGCFTSEFFRIVARSRHLPSSLTYSLEVLVRRTSSGLEILRWQRLRDID